MPEASSMSFLPREINGIPIEIFAGINQSKMYFGFLILSFKPILIATNVSLDDFQELLDQVSSRPYLLVLSWEDGNVFVVDIASRQHSVIAGYFSESIGIALRENYGNIFYSSTDSSIETVHQYLVPDFSFQVNSDYLTNFDSFDLAIVGEIAISQSTGNVLEKCSKYVRDFDVDIAICVDLTENPSSFIENGAKTEELLQDMQTQICSNLLSKCKKYSSEHTLRLYVFDERDIIPEGIDVPFDVPFTFKIRTKAIERKLNETTMERIRSNAEFIEVTVTLSSIATFKKAV